MVTMTCCGNKYGHVTDTIGHRCEVPKDKPQMTLTALVLLCAVSGLLWGIIGGLMTAYVAHQPEDGLFFNCHLSGDGNCGPDTVWHGFVNI